VTGATQPPPVPQPRLDRTVPECPYVGLVPFDESDAPYFFGRRRESELIVANLTASRLTLLYAASGVGKSSVLQAGVLPQLRQIAAESYQDLGVPDAAVVYIREWSQATLDTIATEVLRAVSRVPGAASVEVPGSPRLSVPWLCDVLRCSGVAAIYLVLDQFEEYFLYHPDDRGEDGLTGALGHILSTRDLPVNVLLSIREDALAALDQFKGRVPRLYDNYLRLAHLGRRDAQEAIEGPLKHYNQVVPPDSAMAIEPELTTALLDQVRAGHLVMAPEGVPSGGAADGRDDIEAPYLQLVLTRLWEAERASGSPVLRRSTLDELGGAQKIVQTHLNTVLAGLSPEQLEVAAEVFRYLVTPSGSKIALTAESLADWSRMPVSSVHELLQSLSAGPQRILRPVSSLDEVAGPTRYEIFHDVMGAAVLKWRGDYVAERAQAEAARKLVAEREEARAEAQATRRRLRQTRLLAAGLAVVLLVAGVLGVFFYHASQEAQKASQEAEKQRLLSEAAAALSNPVQSLRKAVEAHRKRDDADTREAVLTAASAPRSRVVAGSRGEPPVAGMVVTPDQRHVVTYDAQGGIRVIDDEGRPTKTVKTARLAGTVVMAATDPSASHIALGTDGGSAVVVDVGAGTQVDLTTDGSAVLAVYWLDSSPDPLVLLATSSGPAATYSATTGRQVASFPGTGNRALPIADDHVVTSDQDSRLRVWNARTGGKVAESSPLPERTEYLRRYGNEVVGTNGHNIIRWDGQSPEPRQYPVTFSHALSLLTANENTHMVAVALDMQVAIYNLDNGAAPRSLPPQPDWVQDVALDPRGQWIATAGADGRVRVWSTTGKEPLSRATYDLVAPYGSVRTVSYLRDGKALVSLSANGTVLLWDIPQVQRVHLGGYWMLDLDISSNGQWLATASADRKVYIVKPPGASDVPPVVTIPVGDRVKDVKFDPTDPHRVVTLSWYRKQPQGWRWDSGGGVERLPEFQIPLSFSSHYLTSYLTSLNISPDGNLVAAGDYRGNVYLWDARTGKLIGDRMLMSSGLAEYGGIAFDPSGKILAATSPDGILLKKLGTGEGPKLLPLPNANTVAFDQRGEYIVGGSKDRGALRVWTRDGRFVHDFVAYGSEEVGRPSFSGDGRLVAVGTGEGLIEVWDVHSGKRVMLVRQHGDMVNDVLFLPGSRSRLVSASNDSTVAVFSCQACDDPDAVIRDAER
jgi:WD40 repeat protein